MNTCDITPAKRRFGVKPRKQWRFSVTAANGERLDPRDTYANVGDILAMLEGLRNNPLRVRIHYLDGIKEMTL